MIPYPSLYNGFISNVLCNGVFSGYGLFIVRYHGEINETAL